MLDFFFLMEKPWVTSRAFGSHKALNHDGLVFDGRFSCEATGNEQPARLFGKHTVDGRNPAPVDMVNIPLFTGFHTCWVV